MLFLEDNSPPTHQTATPRGTSHLAQAVVRCVCPARADDQTIGYYYWAWVLHLLGSILFLDAMSDIVFCMFLPCLIDLDNMGGYNWASIVMSFLYIVLCEACRRMARITSLGGCVPTPVVDVIISTAWSLDRVCSFALVRRRRALTMIDSGLPLGL
jgi:hypothetical protein